MNPLRNPNINYRKGWFFVTFQVARNKTVFGVVADKKLTLNALGCMVHENLLEHGSLVAFVASDTRDNWSAEKPHMRTVREWFGREPIGKESPLVSTFTSFEEQGALARRLTEKLPFIWVDPAGIKANLPAAVRAACEEGRGLVISPEGKVVAPTLTLYGKLTQRDSRDKEGRLKREFILELSIVEISTGSRIWNGKSVAVVLVK